MKLKEYKLGDLIEVTRGMSLPGEFYSTEGEYIRLTCGNFDYVNNSFKENKSKDDLYYVGKIKSEFIMEKGDIITPLTEQAIGLLGSTAIIPESGKYIQSQDVAKVTCKKGMIDHDFAYYLIPSKCVKEQLSAAAQQTKIRHTSPDAIKACKVFVPPLSEQKKIASVLSALDDKIALNKKMNQKLEAMAKRLYDYWFVQYDFPDKNGHPYKTTGGPMTYNPTLKREIPSGWEVKQICDIASFEKESVRPSDNPNIEYKHFSIPGYDECGSYVLETGESILSDKFKVSETDVLVSKLNPWTSRVIWGESREHQICSTEFVVMKLHELKEKGFLYSLVKQPSFIDYCTRGSSGTSHSHRRVNPEYMMDYIFAYDEDAVQSFSAIVSRYALMMMKNLRENRRLTALRDKLLPLLMNGQVTVA